MDTASLSGPIVIFGADDDSPVGRVLPVQPDEVPAIARHQGTPLADGKRHDIDIRNASIGLPGRVGGQHIMAQLPQRRDDGQREVFVAV